MDSQDYGGSALEYLRRLSTQCKTNMEHPGTSRIWGGKKEAERMLPSQIRFSAVSVFAKCIPPNNEGGMVAWGE